LTAESFYVLFSKLDGQSYNLYLLDLIVIWYSIDNMLTL